MVMKMNTFATERHFIMLSSNVRQLNNKLTSCYFDMLPLKLSQLEAKLDTLKQEKHGLFSELKKVLHQENEMRQRAQMKEQRSVPLMLN